MRLIPAIDIMEGKCVRLSQGNFSSQRIYNEDPLEVAKRYEDSGIQYLHLVDLDGARAQKIINYQLLEKIASGTGLKVDFGGGLRSDQDVRIAFECGAEQVTGGSIAVTAPEIFYRWLDTYGSHRIILGADARNGRIAISGWLEESEMELLPFIEEGVRKGLEYVICTDISRDGMLTGPATDLYREILQKNPSLKLIASGGVAAFEDLLSLQEAGCEAAIIGKALYEGRIHLEQLENFILQN